MANLDFNKDIILGEKGEEDVLNDLISMGATFIKYNKNNKYDILIERKNKKLKYEIKTDFLISKKYDTGNIFIEKECRGKKSGIEVTESDWFVTYLINLGEIWYIKTDELRKLIDNNNFRVVVGGDIGSNSTGYLINRKNFRHHFIVRMMSK